MSARRFPIDDEFYAAWRRFIDDGAPCESCGLRPATTVVNRREAYCDSCATVEQAYALRQHAQREGAQK